MSEFDTYDYINTLQAGHQKKSYIIKTCKQSEENNLSLFVTFYDQWKYLPSELFDFVKHGQFSQYPSIIFEDFNQGDLLPRFTVLSITAQLYTAEHLSTTVNEFITDTLSAWNTTFSLTPDNRVQFSLGSIPSGSPQQYASRTVYANVDFDPFNVNFYDYYNIHSWGLNSLTQKIAIAGGTIQGFAPLRSITDIVAPQHLVAPYQTIEEGKIISTFYAGIPPNASWIDGCLAVSGDFVMGTDAQQIIVSSGGVIDVVPPETLVISASLCILIGLSILLVYYHSNFYLKALGLVCIVLGILGLLKQSDNPFQESGEKLWENSGGLGTLLLPTPFAVQIQSSPESEQAPPGTFQSQQETHRNILAQLLKKY